MIKEFVKLVAGILVFMLWFIGIMVCLALIPDHSWIFIPASILLFSTLTAALALGGMYMTGEFDQ